jgi:hypothetical protein
MSLIFLKDNNIFRYSGLYIQEKVHLLLGKNLGQFQLDKKKRKDGGAEEGEMRKEKEI